MTCHIQNVKGQLPCDIIMFCKKSFSGNTQKQKGRHLVRIGDTNLEIGDCVDLQCCRVEVCKASTFCQQNTLICLNKLVFKVL